MKRISGIFLLLIMVFCFGCTHEMEITNRDTYFAPPIPPLREPIKIGIMSDDLTHKEKNRYITAIFEALQNSGHFARVIFPFDQTMHQDQVDVLIAISIGAKYDGRGSNFWVNWPGFLIFAPAIWGYGYVADIKTMVDITNVKDMSRRKIEIPTKYMFRHATLNRTWTEIGWLEISLTPFIGGFFFMDYDDNITSEFITRVSEMYAGYVSKKIILELPQYSSLPATKPSSQPQVQPTTQAPIVPVPPNANTTIHPQVPVNPAIPGTVTQPVPSKTVPQPTSVQPQPKPVN